jgi:hypothetical protein
VASRAHARDRGPVGVTANTPPLPRTGVVGVGRGAAVGGGSITGGAAGGARTI